MCTGICIAIIMEIDANTCACCVCMQSVHMYVYIHACMFNALIIVLHPILYIIIVYINVWWLGGHASTM